MEKGNRWLFTVILLILLLIKPKVQLSGEWVATIYSQDLIGKKHGAYWNGFKCPNISNEINNEDLALAMPGAEFYCLPILVCHKNKCVRAIATDVPKVHRIEDSKGQVYNHIDLYPKLAEELNIKGIQWGDIKVFVEVK